MTATVSQIRAALGTALGSISGVHVRDYLPDRIDDPLVTITPSSFTYHGAFHGGLVTYEFNVVVVVSRVSDRVAQGRLDGFASYDGATSIRAALENDVTLSGIVSDVTVDSTVNIGTLDQNGAVYLTMEFTVQVVS